MSNHSKEEQSWDYEINPKRSLFKFEFREIWRFRDLMMMFVKRDIVTVYKQTILGPLWFIIQPVLTAMIFSFIFGGIAKISVGDGMPQILFYLSSLPLWNYFSETLNITSRTFVENASVFGKVYFPRIVLPMARVISGLIKFLIQLAIFFVVWIYYLITTDTIHPNFTLIFVPLYILFIALISLGFGIIITSLTTKYRDLAFLITFGVQLMMYATPVIYPLSNVTGQKRFYMLLNPLTSIFEAFKYAFLGNGVIDTFGLIYSGVFTIVILVFGVVIFNSVEKKFIDTV